MKLQKLTIHNIASIEDAVIDFEAQPLADSEVFLITGKTGAGKSTILDAICLALYAKTPRLESTNMQGDTKDGDKTVKIDDPRQLMRRNTSEAAVSLTFIGSNDVHYEATWAVSRARKKVTGNMQSKDWQLKNLDTDHILTKDKEIEAEIRAAIGLDFNQFCRTVMLAQGEFTRFLNSKDDEKAEILEKITGVDIYSKIGAKVYEVTGQKKQIWDDAMRLVEGTRTLTDAEIAEKHDALSALDGQYKEIKAGCDKETAKRDWLNKDIELAKGKNDAANALRIAQEVVESEDFKQKERTVNDWNATIDARQWMTEAKKASANKNELNKNLDELAEKYSLLSGGLKYAKAEVDRTEAEIKAIETFVTAEADRSVVYENAQTINGFMDTIVKCRDVIKQRRTNIESENKRLTDELAPAHKKAKDEANNAKDDLDNAESNVKRQEETVAALNLPELREKRDAAKDLLNKIATAQERIETLASAKAQHEKTQKDLAERKAAIDGKIEKSHAMEAPINDAKIRMDAHKEDLDRQKDTIEKFAAELRLKLHVGDLCPVCRQKIRFAFPHEEDLAAFVGDLEKAYNDAEKKYKDLCDAKVILDAEIKTESDAYGRDSRAFNEDNSVSTTEEKALDACKSCGIEKLDDTTLSSLATLAKSTTTTLKELEARIGDGEKLEGEVKKLRNALEAKRKDFEELNAKVIDTERAMSECKSGISTDEALVKANIDEVSNAEQKASEMIVGNWQIDWKESPNEFAKALTSLTNEYNSKIQQKQTLVNKFNTEKNNVANVRDVLTNIIADMPSWKDAEATNIAEVRNLLADVNSLHTSVATTLNQLKTAEDNLNVNNTKLNRFFAEHSNLDEERLKVLNASSSDDIARLNDSLKAAREAVVAKETLSQNAEKLIADHQTKRPELAEDDTIEALTERIEGFEKQLSGIVEKKGAINQELESDKKNREHLGTLIEDAERKKSDYDKWSRMNQLIGDKEGNKFRKIAQSYVLTSLIHSANSYMKTLTDRYTLKVTPGTFVITLEDAYQGFVSRAASTISGGESFLVSLSLALALSDIGQTLSVDTLFIDEGFGTLSGEPLQNAINTLRSLHNKAGRHVGIISHVEELKERIPVQIQVNQEGNNSSSKVKVVPEPEGA